MHFNLHKENMIDHSEITKTIALEKYGIKNAKAHYQLSPKKLQEITVEKGMGKETINGTLAINTGKFTGRSPQDRFLVEDDYTHRSRSSIRIMSTSKNGFRIIRNSLIRNQW